MASKKQQQAFKNKIVKFIKQHGATLGGNLLYEYSLPTNAGDLGISIREPEASSLFTIFCRFDDVDKAKTIVKRGVLNENSGKWNFHSSNAADCYETFVSCITDLLP